MAELSRFNLRDLFKDAERPSGAHFASIFDSTLNKVDDNVNVDPVSKNMSVPAGLTLGDAVSGVPGTLRFNAGNVQVFDGAIWNSVAGASGAFTPVLGGPNVAFGGGNVGIGPFVAAPTFKLEVPLGTNTVEGDQVKFGNAVISNGQGATQSYAQFAHVTKASGSTNFALRQGPNGDVVINAPITQNISILHNNNTPRLTILPSGSVILGGNAALGGSTVTLQVVGDAVKSTGLQQWTIVSDGRYKKDVRNFDDGLDKLMQVRTVKYRYNGELNTNPEKEEIGIIGQEIQQVFPYMTSREPISDNAKSAAGDDVMLFNGSALTYVMINAIQELAGRVKDLEARLQKSGQDIN